MAADLSTLTNDKGQRFHNCSGAQRKSCIEVIAVHEFGHAIGLSHEQNRPDRPSDCSKEAQGQDGDTTVGSFDRDSVMNYCNVIWNNNGVLSASDIKGIQTLYGKAAQVHKMIDDNSRIFTGDVNGDGKLDLIGIGAPDKPNAGAVYVAYSNGIGFSKWDWNSSIRLVDDQSKIVIGDVNGDGKADIVSIGAPGKSNAGFVYVALSNGTGYPGWNWNTSTRMLDDGSPIYLGDVNGDGKADIVSVGAPGSSNAGFVYVALSNGVGYPSWSWNTSTRMIDDGSSVAIGDVNGDGKADMVSVGATDKSNAGFVYVALSNGLGYPGWNWNTSARMLDDGSPLLLGDVNGDGKADIVSVGATGKSNAGYVYTALSNGAGFPGWTWNSDYRMIDGNSNLALGDINGDRKVDLLGVGAPDKPNAGYVYVSLSNTSGFPGWNWNSY